MIEAFRADSHIAVNLSTYGSNDEAEQKLKAAGNQGFDVIFPSVTNGDNSYPDDLLQPPDEGQLNLGNVSARFLFRRRLPKTKPIGNYTHRASP